MARQALRDAVRAIDQAEIAERAGDGAAIRRRIDEGERLIRAARRNLPSSGGTSIGRSMLEAAEYLDFVVGSYRQTGDVDGTLTQFATRELNRAPVPGETPLDC
ncbi:MAG TPA: hypothetical protein VFK54_09235 [Candidatus Limnocylindrales bacterium]|nr:hypothetical protein [Candidatus Limnocylindrales bacterium]